MNTLNTDVQGPTVNVGQFDSDQNNERLRFRSLSIADIVLRTFTGTPAAEDETRIIFLDWDRKNTRLSNLLYATEEEYIAHHFKYMSMRHPDAEFRAILKQFTGNARASYLISNTRIIYNLQYNRELTRC